MLYKMAKQLIIVTKNNANTCPISKKPLSNSALVHVSSQYVLWLRIIRQFDMISRKMHQAFYKYLYFHFDENVHSWSY